MLHVHRASKETYRFFRATLTKIHHIKMNHLWAQISYSPLHEAHLKNQRVAVVKKEKNVVKLQKVIFQKSQKQLAENTTKGRLFRTFNSYTFNFKSGLCNRHSGYCPCRAPCPGGKQFMWFLKNDLLQFHLILLFLTRWNVFFFEMCLVRSTLANLCPTMTHFNALGFKANG